MTRTGVLVMSYGTPQSRDDIEAYYTHVRRGSAPPPDLLAQLIARYDAIGGHSPLAEITEAQAKGIAERVPDVTAYVGYKHARPFIEDAIEAMRRDGIDRVIGLVLAPHYSAMSIGEYARRARGAWPTDIDVVPSWHRAPGYIEWVARRVAEALGAVPPGSTVVFSAHSLPARVLETNDPYPDQLRETADAVVRRVGAVESRVAYQSAGRTREPWLGPDILDVIDELGAEGAPGVVICPCGFVADHLEVLYDVDIEARTRADAAGLPFARTRSPNDDPEFLDALADVVRNALPPS